MSITTNTVLDVVSQTLPESTDSRACHLCGSTHGPAIMTPAGWLCLTHMPKVGRRANRDWSRK